jgi:2-dehydro-3-deoxyphosphogalactonate aldolase
MSRNIIAILRGITPAECSDVCDVLISSGIDKIEVPLNSPDPFESISIMVKLYGQDATIGAGTVLQVDQVRQLYYLGAAMVVSPDCNTDVITTTKDFGMASYPGCFTASECFSAIRAGADGLKLFPSFVLGTMGLSALRAVLPDEIPVFVVGGVDASNFADWRKAGALGFGIGTALYAPGSKLSDIKKSANDIVKSYDNLDPW